jgi:hypothetical protein
VLECKSDCDDYILGETGRTDSREQLGFTQPLNGTMGDDEFRKELPTMGWRRWRRASGWPGRGR